MRGKVRQDQGGGTWRRGPKMYRSVRVKYCKKVTHKVLMTVNDNGRPAFRVRPRCRGQRGSRGTLRATAWHAIAVDD